MTTTIFFVRHGITAANKEKRFAGRTGEPLHPEGESQIREVGEGLKKEKISQIYSGPLPRTRQSAAIFGEILGAPVLIEERLNEIFIPHWDGLTKDEIRKKYGPEYPTWLEQPQNFYVPGCETIADVQNRTIKAVERIFSRHAGKKVLVVSHLIVLRCLTLHYQGLPIKKFRTIKIDNGSVTRLSRNSFGETQIHSLFQAS